MAGVWSDLFPPLSARLNWIAPHPLCVHSHFIGGLNCYVLNAGSRLLRAGLGEGAIMKIVNFQWYPCGWVLSYSYINVIKYVKGMEIRLLLCVIDL
jgi:hypothetical protein